MSLWQGKSKRKSTGGRLRLSRKKRRFEIGTDPLHTLVGKQKLLKVRTRGAGSKIRVLHASFANVINPADNKAKKVKIVTVKKNPANPNYVQRNIITKGAFIQTEAGMAKVTSRPGQDGCINAVLVKE